MSAARPPRKEKIQHLLHKKGRKIYQDVNGVNDHNKYFLPDNTDGAKLRPIQTGRYFNFTGVEWIELDPPTVTCDVSTFLFGIQTTNTDNQSRYLFDTTRLTYGGVTGTRFIIATNVFNEGTPQKLSIYVKNAWWHTNADLTDGNFHDIKIILSGDTITVKNDDIIVDSSIYASTFDGWGGGSVMRISAATSFQLIAKLAYFEFRNTLSGNDVYQWRFNCDDASGLVARDALTVNGNNGTIDLGGSSESSFHATSNEVPSAQNEAGHWFSGNAEGVGALTPIAQDTNGKTDVLGNPVPFNYHGRVRYDGLIKGSSVMNFDGNLVLSFSDLTGITIIDQQGEVTVEIVGNNVQPVSGTGKLYYLEFSNGSFYYGSETNGNSGNLSLIDNNETNQLNGTWTLNGSSAGTQWKTSDFQYPKNILEGYWVATPDDGVKYPYNVGGDKTFVPPYVNSIIPSENTYNRNPKDAPILVAAGIPDTESISYTDITSDNTRYYDNREYGRVSEMLVYSDIPEPVPATTTNKQKRIDNYIRR